MLRLNLNLIRNAALMVLGEQVPVENKTINDFKAMANQLISSCLKESWISIMASNTLNSLTTASSLYW